MPCVLNVFIALMHIYYKMCGRKKVFELIHGLNFWPTPLKEEQECSLIIGEEIEVQQNLKYTHTYTTTHIGLHTTQQHSFSSVPRHV